MEIKRRKTPKSKNSAFGDLSKKMKKFEIKINTEGEAVEKFILTTNSAPRKILTAALFAGGFLIIAELIERKRRKML